MSSLRILVPLVQTQKKKPPKQRSSRSREERMLIAEASAGCATMLKNKVQSGTMRKQKTSLESSQK
jgi:hypothetical protein